MSNSTGHRLMAMGAALFAVSLAFVLASCGSQPGSPSAPSTLSTQTDAKGGAGGGSEQCMAGGTKVEHAPYSLTAPEGEVVSAVCVKAGTQSIPVVDDDGSYDVSGLGTTSAEISKVGTGKNCKDISYVTEVYVPERLAEGDFLD